MNVNPNNRLGLANVWQPVGFLLIAVVLGSQLAKLPLPFAAGLLLAIGGGLIILINPAAGLGLALLAGPFGALENVLFGGSGLDSGQILLLLTLAAWLGKGMMRRRLYLPRTSLNVPLGIFLGVATLSLLDAPSVELGIRELIKWIEIGLIMWLVVDEWQGSEKPSQRFMLSVLIMLLLAGLVQSLIGIWQFGLRGSGPEHFSILGRFFRAYGTFEQPNPFGGFMNLTALLALGTSSGLVIAFWRKWRAGASRRTGRRLPGLPSLLAAPSLSRDTAVTSFIAVTALAASVSVFFSWSRGAWLGLLAGLVAITLNWSKKWWQGVLLLLAVAVLAAGLLLAAAQLNRLPAGLVERFTDLGQGLQFGDVRGVDINPANYAELERLAYWQVALDMARSNLWLGVGFGNYAPAYSEYGLLNWPTPLGHAHNYYLNILAEAGVLGLAAYLIFWTAVIRQTFRVLKHTDWPHRGIALGLMAAWIALLVHSLVDKLYVNNIYVHLGVMLGLLQVMDQAWRLPDHNAAAGADQPTVP